jgi:hypothetical protein
VEELEGFDVEPEGFGVEELEGFGVEELEGFGVEELEGFNVLVGIDLAWSVMN